MEIENVLAVKSHAIKKTVISIKHRKWETTDVEVADSFVAHLEMMGCEVETKIEDSECEISDLQIA